MENSNPVKRIRPLRDPTTTPVGRSPLLTPSARSSVWISPEFGRTVAENGGVQSSEFQEGSLPGSSFRRDSSRGFRGVARDMSDEDSYKACWDRRGRSWSRDLAEGENKLKNIGQEARTSRRTSVSDEATKKGIDYVRNSLNRNRNLGWMSEIEAIPSRKSSSSRDGYNVASKIRSRERTGVKGRRRGYYVVDVKQVELRRKVMRREQARRGHKSRRSFSSLPQGVRRVTAEVPLPLSTTSIDGHQHPAKAFSLLTLEEYLHEKGCAHQSDEGDFDSFSLERGSSFSRMDSHCQSPLFAKDRIGHREQKFKGARKPHLSVLTTEAARLREGLDEHLLSNSRASHGQNSSICLPSHGAREAVGHELEASDWQRHGCGIPWHWSRVQKDKGKKFTEFTEKSFSCGFPVSKRRKSRKMIVRSRLGCMRGSRIGRCNSERSVSSFDSDIETVPLLTEPEVYQAYSDDDVASSIDIESDSPLVLGELELHRYSRLEDGRKGVALYRGGTEDFSENTSRRSKMADMEEKHRGLSQKYRPRSFRELVGQNMVAQSLSNAISKGKIAPVYLFQGPRGTGKTSTARIFAAALNCVSAEELRPCGFCKECIVYASGKNFDVREVNAAGNNGIESMKALLNHIVLPPLSSHYKVFIVDECHTLTSEAWNTFLKSLEEPPTYVVFILITTEPEKVPRTAVSRCQKFLFPKIKDSDILARLQNLAMQEKIAIDQEALQLLTTRADGSLRDAETTLDQLSLLGEKINLPMVRELVGLIPDDKLINLLDLALSANTVSTVRCIRELMESGVEPLALTSQLATLITDILAGNTSAKDRSKKGFSSRHYLSKDELERLRQALKILSEAEKQLRACNDRSTWLTAALLQFAPNDSYLLPTSSLGTSVTQSPVTFLDTSEKDTVELDFATAKQPWEGEEQLEHSKLHLEVLPAPNLQATRNEKAAGTAKENGNIVHNYSEILVSNLTGSLMDNRIHPCNQSPQGGIHMEAIKPLDEYQAAAAPGHPPDATELDQREGNMMSPCTMDDIWRKVLEGSKSNVLRQVLCGQGKLLSLSVSEAFAVVHLEFQEPQHKIRAERAKTGISNAFEVALGCPVEVKISLASLQGKESFGIDNTLVPENAGNDDRNKGSPYSSKFEGRVHAIDGVSDIQEPRASHDGASSRRTLRAAKLSTPYASNLRSTVGTFNHSNVGLLNKGFGRELVHTGHLSEDRINSCVQVKFGPSLDPFKSNKRWNMTNFCEFPNDQSLSMGGSALSVGFVEQADRNVDGYSQELVYDQFHGSYRGNVERDHAHAPDFSKSMEESDIDGHAEDNLSSKPRYRHGSLLCWKGNRMEDGKAKQHNLRRKRRAEFLLRLVPCSKADTQL